MDSQEVALASWAACCPPLVWLLCATLVSICKRHLRSIEYGAKHDEVSVYVDFPGTRDFFFSTVVDVSLLSLDVAVNFIRTLLGYLPLLFLFLLCISGSLLALHFNAEIIFVVDTTYEFFRPNLVETVLQILNFARVVFALFVGLWNASVETALIPLRVLFDSAYECGGKGFVKQVAHSGANVVKEFSHVVASFFENWKRDDVFDVDVTLLTLRSREFLQKFIEIIECSCDPLTSPHVTRTVAYPLWSATTDTFVNNATRTVLKAIQIPYESVTKITADFEPLFDVVLGENGGVLASGAALGNEYFHAVTDFVQSGVSPEFRFAGPPIFSLVHRSMGTVLEMLRTTVKSVAALPEMINKGGSRAADEAHIAGSTYAIKHNFNSFFDVLFVDILSTLHDSWAVYGKVLADATHLVSETMEMGYNFTLDGAVGVPREKYVSANDETCASELRFTVNVLDRTRFAFTSGAKSFSTQIVPRIEMLSESIRRVLSRDMLLTPTAEFLHTAFLVLVFGFEALVNTVSYLVNALLRLTPVTQECMQKFQAPYWQQIDDTFTAMPNLITSFTAFDETNDSGYANLVCARSNHVNHVYSGSLKAYIFASSACATKYDGTQVYPKCSYRSDNFTLQAELCSKLVAYADYNTSPLCATGDELAEVLRSLNIIYRTFFEYWVGIIIAVWNCLAGLGAVPTASDAAECVLSLSKESLPSSAVYDLLECQVAELVYRFTNIIVSRWTPIFTAIYSLIKYPADGYYATGVDGLQHTQARPVEAAYATAYTSVLNLVFFYPTHTIAEAGRAINAFFEQIAGGNFSFEAYGRLRVELQILAMRSSLLGFRDVLVGITELVRSLDTVVNYKKQTEDCVSAPPAPSSVDGGRVETCANPGKVSATFQSLHRNVLFLVDIIQQLQELLTDKFIEGMDKFFELFTMLLSSLLKGDTSKMKTFFVELIDELADILSAVVEGIFRLIITQNPGTVNPFRFLFCNVLGGVKDGVCGFLGFKFIPREFSLECLSGDNKCAWLPGGKITLFKVKTDDDDDGTPDETSATQTDLGGGDSPVVGGGGRINALYSSATEAAKYLGFVWLEAFGTFSEGDTVVSNAKISPEKLSDYRDTCPLITNTTACEKLNTISYNDVYENPSKFYSEMRLKCERKKYCSNDLDAEGFCKDPDGSAAFKTACFWEADMSEDNSYGHGPKGTCKSIRNAKKFNMGGFKVVSQIVNVAGVNTTFYARLATLGPDPTPITGSCSTVGSYTVCFTMENFFPRCYEGTGRRHLLGGDPIGDAVDAVVDGANAIANAAKDIANDAVDLANDAKDFAVDAANEAANIVKDAVKWVEDTVNVIKNSIPSGKFTVTAASIAEAANVDMDALQCTSSGLSQCDVTPESNSGMEPTVCNSENDCLASDALCWTPDMDMCLNKTTNHDAYAKSCGCSTIAGGKVHCNYGSGTCQAGQTPFRPPLTSCASAGGLVSGSDGYNSLCYVSPLWMCAGAADKTDCRADIGSGKMTLQGPSLCRSFCDPTFENRNNHLVQYRFPTLLGHVDKCVCEVGVDRVFPHQTKESSAATIVMNTPWSTVFGGLAAVTGRRKLLQSGNTSELPDFEERTKKIFTPCTSSSQCTTSFRNASLCRSLWGDPIPCYSCSERVHGTSKGYGCDSEEKECACTVVRDLDYGDSKLVDIDEWRGNSWCDKIMRGYKTTAMRSPLERVWIHRCFVMRGLGKSVTTYLGVPSVPQDFMYNPSRLLSVGADVVEGIFTYYSENFDDDTTDRREEYFNRLVEKNIDPLVTLSALRVFSVVYNSVTIAFSRLDLFGATRAVLGTIDPRAKELLDEGVEMTKPLVTKMGEVLAHTNFTGFVGHTISNARTVYELVAEARLNESAPLNATEAEDEVGDYADLPTPAVMSELRAEIVPFVETAPLNESDDALFPLDPFDEKMRRRLLIISQCTVIQNVKDRVVRIADTLDAYYGTNDKYLDATLCAYETFLGKGTFGTCGQPKGQSGGQEFDVRDGFPDTGGISFSVGYVRKTVEKMEKWIKDEPTQQTLKIIDFFEENVVGRRLTCDAAVLLCNKRQRSLISAAWVVEGWAFIAFAFFTMSGISSVGIGVFLTVQVSVLFPAILSLAYSYPMSCLPRLPVCLGDDLFDLVTTVFPEHISWPSRIVFNETRGPPEGVSTLPWMQQLRKSTGIENCRDHMFTDLFDPFFWSREYIDAPWFSILEWPLIRFNAQAHRISEKWKKINRNEIIDQCGLINVQGVIPPLIISFFFYVALSFATVPGIRVATRAAKRAFPNLRRSVMDLLDLSTR